MLHRSHQLGISQLRVHRFAIWTLEVFTTQCAQISTVEECFRKDISVVGALASLSISLAWHDVLFHASRSGPGSSPCTSRNVNISPAVPESCPSVSLRVDAKASRRSHRSWTTITGLERASSSRQSDFASITQGQLR